jgi:hypothetical protein
MHLKQKLPERDWLPSGRQQCIDINDRGPFTSRSASADRPDPHVFVTSCARYPFRTF